MMFTLRSLDKLSLKLILSILFIGIIYFVYKKSQQLGTNETFAPTAESVNECAESARVMKQAIDDNVSDNKKSFDNATVAWNEKKTAAQTTFNNTPTIWAAQCTGTRCEPTNAFFNVFPNTVFHGHDLQGGQTRGVDEEQCQRTCRARNDCFFYSYNQGASECWIKGAPQPSSGHISALKGKNGWVQVTNNANWVGNVYEEVSGDYANCVSNCQNDTNCMGYTWANNNWCFKKGSGGRAGGFSTGVKEGSIKVDDFSLDDADPYIIAKAGAKPQEKDYKTALNLPALVCQDCRQQISDVSATDSQATLNQTNQCIANLERQVAAAPSPPSSLNPAPITPTPGATSYSLPGMIPAESSTVPVKRNYTPIYIGGGLTSCIFMCVCVLILAAIGYMVMSAKKD